MSLVMPLPEGTILAGCWEVRRDLGRVGDGYLYEAFNGLADRPYSSLLLVRPGDAPADLRGAEVSLDGDGVLPPVIQRFPHGGQQCLVLGARPGDRLTELGPVLDDETAVAVLRAAAVGLAQLEELSATADYRPENLLLTGDGRLIYPGPVTSGPPPTDLAALAGLIAAEVPLSQELGDLLAALGGEGVGAFLERAVALDWPGVEVAVGQASDGGPYRLENQDAATHLRSRTLTQPEADAWDLLVVADGVGGHRGGREAARIALSSFVSGFVMTLGIAALDTPHAAIDNRLAEEALTAALAAAQETVEALARDDEPFPPGATIVGAARIGRRLFVTHVGDARAYLLRRGTLHRLTRDDSVVQELVDRGQLTADEVRGHPEAHRVTRCLGMVGLPEPPVTIRLLLPGDRLLLCTDGVTERLRDDVLADLLEADEPAGRLAAMIVEAARRAGGRDNITAQTLLVEGLIDG